MVCGSDVFEQNLRKKMGLIQLLLQLINNKELDFQNCYAKLFLTADRTLEDFARAWSERKVESVEESSPSLTSAMPELTSTPPTPSAVPELTPPPPPPSLLFEMTSPPPRSSAVPDLMSLTPLAPVKKSATCVLCGKIHVLARCPEFGLMAPTDRRLFCRSKGICRRCVDASNPHNIFNCKKEWKCVICDSQVHHSMLHEGEIVRELTPLAPSDCRSQYTING